MKYKSFIPLVVLLLAFVLFTACETVQQPTALENNSEVDNLQPDLKSFDSSTLNFGRGQSILRVMTRNIYIGADVAIVLSAQSPEEIPILVAQAYQQLLGTNFSERAVALANEVFLTRPDMIGLQEVTLLRYQSPGDAVYGGTEPAEDVLMDYLDIFMATLNAYGLHYKVAAKVQNMDIELPMLTSVDPLLFDDMRVTDFDVMLVREYVNVTEVVEKNYTVNLFIPEMNLELPCGYCAVNASIGHRTYRFVSTHLEAIVPEVRVAQAQELLVDLEDETLPIVMLGDFNTEAFTGQAYNLIQSYGYTDVWTLNILPFNPEGYTFGHDPDLLNEVANFTQRIDFVFVKSETAVPEHALAIVVGDEPFNRTESGLWPSDHGGIVASFAFPRKHRPLFAHMNQ